MLFAVFKSRQSDVNKSSKDLKHTQTISIRMVESFSQHSGIFNRRWDEQRYCPYFQRKRLLKRTKISVCLRLSPLFFEIMKNGEGIDFKETIKRLPKKPDPILLAQIFEQVTTLGAIHAQDSCLSPP